MGAAELREEKGPDEQIVERVMAGDTPLFEVLMRRYNQRLFRAARAILKDDADAEDVVQEAYVRAFAHLRDFERRASFATWLTKITIYEALARARKRGRFETMDTDDETEVAATSTADPERAASQRQLAAVVEEAIDRLPVAFRAVLLLRTVEGLSVAETAASLGIAEETVRTRLHRARAALRDCLQERTAEALPQVHPFDGARCDRIVAAVLARLCSRA
jgi:RNA polymerase sigma-70 factor (ECF subfamily)